MEQNKPEVPHDLQEFFYQQKTQKEEIAEAARSKEERIKQDQHAKNVEFYTENLQYQEHLESLLNELNFHRNLDYALNEIIETHSGYKDVTNVPTSYHLSYGYQRARVYTYSQAACIIPTSLRAVVGAGLDIIDRPDFILPGNNFRVRRFQSVLFVPDFKLPRKEKSPVFLHIGQLPTLRMYQFGLDERFETDDRKKGTFRENVQFSSPADRNDLRLFKPIYLSKALTMASAGEKMNLPVISRINPMVYDPSHNEDYQAMFNNRLIDFVKKIK